MLKQLSYVMTAAFVMSVTMASTATAQGTLGFTIDPTQGFPATRDGTGKPCRRRRVLRDRAGRIPGASSRRCSTGRTRAER